MNGFMFDDFHKLCDGVGPTVSLFRVKKNQDWIGGYTSVSWESCDDNEWHDDDDAFLFSLTQLKHFPLSDNTRGV